ncbi:MAG TPA: M13 family metallopeptidase [Elusimicrobiota bacterium]|jgi:predicted metalloendopeptidase|nr:M13 family metallopeptidase [Elusimicrobiota bacterium]
MITLALLAALAAPLRADDMPAPIKAFDVSALDRSVSPCQDFYQFACGGWIKSHPIPADQSRWGRFNELAERNKAVLRDILEKAAAGPKADPVDKRLGDFYGACMDAAAADKKGDEPLQPDFKAIDALSSSAQLPALLAHLHAEGVNAGFSFDSDQDYKDASKVIGEFDQAGLGLPDRDYYLKTDAKSALIRKQYVWHVAKVFGLLGDDLKTSAAEAETVMRLETELAKVSMDRVSRRDPDNVYHRMSEKELAKLAPGFDWNEYDARTDAPKSRWLNVVSTGFVSGFSSLLNSEPLSDWKTYLRWHVASSASPWLSKDFVDESFDFGGRKLTGAKELKPRWKRCVELTDSELGHDLGRRYVELTFGPDGMKRTKELIGVLRGALRADLKTVDWMAAKTRRKALEKLGDTTDKIGYPAKWRDYKGVAIDRDDLLASIRSADAYETRRRLNKIGKPVDRMEWDMTPPTVNAYYDPQLNQINFPAGILQSPFFDRDGDPAFNLGAIGVVIGHEMTHGYDDQGRKFDGQGNMRNWWTPGDAKKFEARAQCLVDQYGSYSPLPGVKLNGRLTLGENTADNGGVRLATNSLPELEKMDHVAADVNGFTPAQRLYLGFAQVWCQNSTDESKRLLATVDPHSDAHSRVLGPLSNTPEFGKAFSCKVGDPMMPAKTCRVW